MPSSLPPSAPPSSRVPLASHVLLISIMVLFFSACTLITLQANWLWWVIPLIALVVAGAIVGQRISRRQRRMAELTGDRS